MLTYYTHILKDNGFINSSVHGDAKRKESRNFDWDAVSEFGMGRLHIDEAYLPDTTRHSQGAIFTNIGQWIFQETNPVNNQHSRVMDSDDVQDPTSNDSENTVPLDMASEKPVLSKLHTYRFTLDNWNCYLHRCTTYHTSFVR